MLIKEFHIHDVHGGGERVRWVSRGANTVATIEVDADALMWLVDHLPKSDDATKELEKIVAGISEVKEDSGSRIKTANRGIKAQDVKDQLLAMKPNQQLLIRKIGIVGLDGKADAAQVVRDFLRRQADGKYSVEDRLSAGVLVTRLTQL